MNPNTNINTPNINTPDFDLNSLCSYSTCFRCKKNPIEYKCNDCPPEFNKLCSICDTDIHSKIPFKMNHNRKRFFKSFPLDENKNSVYKRPNDSFEISKEESPSKFPTKDISPNDTKLRILNETKNSQNKIIDDLIKRNEELLKENKDLKAELNYLQHNDEDVENYYKKIVSDLNKKMKNYQTVIKDYQQKIKELEDKNEEQNNFIETQILSKDGLMKKMDEKIEEQKNLNQLNELLEFKYNTLTEDKNNLINMVGDLKEENKDL
ncbi:MAG: hypothetical protein MJ252_15115, partial [archaeon]|nr:hypothetical protein [archaeon]